MQEQFQNMNNETPDNTAGITPEDLMNSINSDDTISGTNHLNEAVAEENEVDTLKAEVEEQKDKYLRLFAEFDNFKRRSAKERMELIQTAGKEIINGLLSVLDDCDRAEKVMAATTDITVVKEGVQLVFNKLRNTLQSRGVKAMETVGTEFNADIHEAITEIPAPTPKLVGKVVDEVEKGYFLNDKIIRFAKVVVGK